MLSRQHITLAALLSLTPGLAFATPSKITWTKGAGTPDFVTPGNWQSGNVTLSTLPDDTTSAITQFSGPADQASNVASTHSVAGVEIAADAGNVTLTGNATLIVGDSGVADNAVAGNQSISAPLDFTGNSSLITSAGTLEISGSVANNTSQGLHLGGSTTSSKLSGPISGTGDLIKDDAGSWKLNAANSYTGKTIVDGGTLQLGAAGALPNGKDLIVTPHGVASATLDLNGTNQQIGTLTLGGDAGATAAINLNGGSLTLAGDVVYDATMNPGTANISGGSLDLGGNRTFNVGQSGGSSNGDLTISAGITGNGANLTKTGSGKLVLAGSNSFNGQIAVNGGTLAINSDANLGAVPATATSGVVALNDGTLEVTADTTVNANRGIALGGTAGGIQVDGTARLTYGGMIAGSAALNKTGTGTLTLSGSNTYSGGTYILSGTVSDAADGALPATGGVYLSGGALAVLHNESIHGLGDWTGDGFVPGNVTIANNATLNIVDGSGSFSGNITGAGTLVMSDYTSEVVTGNVAHTGGTKIGRNATLEIGNGGTAGAVAGNITNDGGLMFNRSDNVTYGGINGAGHIYQEGNGTLTLSGTNTYSGETYIAAGTLADANPNAFSPNSVIHFLAGNTTLNVNANEAVAGLGSYFFGGNLTVNLNGALTIGGTGSSFNGAVGGSGSLTIGPGAHQTFTGPLTHTGGTTVANGGTLTIGDGSSSAAITGAITNNGKLVFNPSASQSYNGVISGSGSLTVSDSSGTLALGGANTYAGDTNVNSSTLRVSVVNALPVGTSVSLVDDGTLDVEADQAIGQLLGSSGYVTLGSGKTLTIAPPGSKNAGNFQGFITGAGTLVVNAPGTSLTLNGSGDYSGGTTVNGGALVVGSNNGLGSGGVTMKPGTALLVGDSDASDVTLSNAVDLNNNVTLGGGTHHYGLGLAGQVSVEGSAATVHVNDSVALSGGLKAAAGTSAVTFDSTGGGFGKAILLGAVDPSITSITASGAGVVFGAQAAVPASGLSLGANNGYIGIGYMNDASYVTPTAASVLNLIGSKSTFGGAIGFDTLAHSGAPHAFSDAIDLSGFGAGTTLGSSSQAVLTGTITPGANGYRFGNGGGVLFIQSALTGGNVTVASATSVPGNSLAAVFEGDNSFTGNLSVSNSIGVLDSAHALPNGRTVTLGDNGYIGFTEAFTPAASLASFIAHQLAPGGYTATSVLGLDSHQAAADTLAHGSASETRYVSDTIDLSGLSSVYLGTATGLTLSGKIIAPNQGGANKTLSLLAAGDSTLTITSALTADNVSSVRVGSAAAYATGKVALLGTSTYGGGTTLRSGTLQLQGSSHVVNGTIVAGPLGAGALTVNATGQKEPVLSSAGWLMLDNAISLGGPLQLGTFTYDSLVLNGVIGDLGGGHGSLDVAGQTQLNGANTFTGGVNLVSGGLSLGDDRALGTGTLTITGDRSDGESVLTSSNGPRTLANPIVITGTSSDYVYINGNFTLNGSLTLNSPARLALSNSNTLTLNGPVTGPAPLTTEYGTFVMNPTSPSTASGGFTSEDGVLILGNANAVPANPVTNAFTSNYDGYVGIGFVPGNLQTDFINRFDKGQTEGAIGFDSASAASPNIFNTPVNLQGFSGSTRLGSATSAILGAAATLTPQDTTYNFGGGGGFLRVDSALGDDPAGASRDVNIVSNVDAPLTLRLTGANTYRGGTELSWSGVIFGTNALPAQGSIGGDYAYAGTEDPVFATNPTAFANRISPSSQHMIVGFDSTGATPIAVTGDLSLASLNDTNAYIGTATSAVISGNITLANSEMSYHFAGFKGGQLTIASLLTGAVSVVIGDQSNPGTFANSAASGSTLSRVTLTGANSYTGSTYLYAGELFAGNVTALGTGALILGDSGIMDSRHVGFSATASGMTLANNINIGTVDLDVGASDATFGLSGTVTGARYSGLYKVGAGTLTLSGNNAGFAGDVVVQGGGVVFAPAASGSSFGTGRLRFDSPSASNVTFQDNVVVNGIEDDRGTGTITLTAGKTFGINQTADGEFDGAITGSTAALTLTGSGYQLRLAGDNTYVGPTTVQSGTVVAGSATAFGNAANAVALSGGGIVVEPGVTISNPLMVTSGKLGGSGTVVASSITIGANTILAPGEADAVGTLHFANSLTFGNNGTLQLRLSDTSASGTWDQVQVAGNLAITAASATPFTLQVVPFTAGGLLTSMLPANFNPYTAGSWMVVSAGSISGFSTNRFTIDSTAFSGALQGGTFSLAMNATNTGLMLNFTPVPEPSTYALMLAGIGTMFLVSRRRRRRG